MVKKLKRVLLIDDDEPTNFIHRKVIRDAAITEEIIVKTSGQDALDYLASKVDGNPPSPDLIFLDINMPAMNGWEFLDEYDTLEEGEKGKVIVIMLTTSLNPDDEAMAESRGIITGFKNKPLTKAMLHEILEHHFQERFKE